MLSEVVANCVVVDEVDVCSVDVLGQNEDVSEFGKEVEVGLLLSVEVCGESFRVAKITNICAYSYLLKKCIEFFKIPFPMIHSFS